MRRSPILFCLFFWLLFQMMPGHDLPGVRQAIAGTGDKSNLTDIILVLDNSGSMKKNDPEFLTRDVVTGFLSGFGEKARIGMVVFDQEVRLAEPLMSLVNLQERGRFLQSLDTINYSGLFSDSPAAVERALYELKYNGREDADQVIILLTDGIVDTGDRARDIEKTRWLKEDLARESEYAGIKIFGIAFTDKADFSIIQTLAIRTGGGYFRAFKAEDIQGIFDKILAVIRRPTPKTVVAAAAVKEPIEKPEPDVTMPLAPAVKPAAPAAGRAEGESSTPASSGPAVKTERSVPTAPQTAGQRAAEPSQPVQQRRFQELIIPVVLIAVLVLLAAVIVIQLMNRKTIPAKAAEAVTGIPRTASRKSPIIPLAELVDTYNITGRGTVKIDKRQMKIGRDKNNDIVIPKETVSSIHAVIEYRDGFFHLEDQRSKNKTRLNGIEIGPDMPRKLKSGDEISFNKFKFKFVLPNIIPVGETVIDFGRKGDSAASMATMVSSPKASPVNFSGMPQAMLIDLKNITGRKTMNIDKSIIHVGRGVHNDVVIARDSISGSHATIEYRNEAFFLEDRRSKNKTRLNGEEIPPHAPEKLKSGDEVMFDEYKFIFLLEYQIPAGDTDENW